MEENIERINRFLDFAPHHKEDGCGFWLTTRQLRQLINDLENQGSSGLAFMVGVKGSDTPETRSVLASLKFNVELVPLEGPLEKFENQIFDPTSITMSCK